MNGMLSIALTRPHNSVPVNLLLGTMGHNRHNAYNGGRYLLLLPLQHHHYYSYYPTKAVLLIISISSSDTFLFVDCAGTRRKCGASRTDTKTFSRRKNGVWHGTTNYCKRWRISITAHQPLPQKLKDSSCSKLVRFEYKRLTRT